MKKLIFFIILLNFLLSCKSKSKSNEIIIEKPILDNLVDDSSFILDKTYSKGDVRRYGIYPNKTISHQNLKNVLLLASKGLPIVFPEGYYETNLVLDNIANVNFTFKNATITGGINIVNYSNRINFSGKLMVLDRLFVKESSNISFDSLIVKTNTIFNIRHNKNRGVSLYAGSKNISFKFLIIENTGGTKEEFYKYTAAALQVHGWNNNPKNIYIDDLQISNAGRTALYLTGTGHKISKVKILNYGLGSSKNMFGLEDAAPGHEKEFSGAWINKCSNCEIDSLEIINDLNKGRYNLRLDQGKYHEPTFIFNIHIDGKTNNMRIKSNKLTNILVKHEY
jgi:hypothetical protein